MTKHRQLGYGLIVACMAVCCRAEISPDATIAPPPEKHGIRLDELSLYGSAHSSQAQGGASTTLGDGGYTASLSWSRIQNASSYVASYSTSFSGRMNINDWKKIQQILGVDFQRRISARWENHTLVSVGVLTSDQFLFQPTYLDSVAQGSTTVSDLFGGVSGSGLGSKILSPSGALRGDSSALFYGSSVFATTFDTRLSYRYSPRLTISGGVAASRSQVLDDRTSTGVHVPTPATTSGGGSVSLAYEVSPRSELGFESGIIQGFGNFGSTVSTSVVSYSRTLSRNTFLSVQGGYGYSSPSPANFENRSAENTLPVSTGTSSHLVGGAQFGFKQKSHTFVAGFGETSTRVQGFGPALVRSASGSWLWKSAGGRSSLSTSLGRDLAVGDRLSASSAWRGTALIRRMISRRLSIFAEYSYLSNSRIELGLPFDQRLSGARAGLLITPAI